tara:strand:- start:624 stop:1352 length:729 start_codon:yes stop_codon:yes gene_type:complete
MNEQLAELCGIIVGDGHLNRTISPNRNSISIFGHDQDDLDYFLEIQDLFEKELRKRPILKRRIGHKGNRYLELRACSRAVLEKFEKIGIPVGKKSGIVNMPEIIKKKQGWALSFLRGVADTDFSLVFKKRKTMAFWPRITADMKSKELIVDCCEVLANIGIKVAGPYRKDRFRNEKPYTTYQIDINGRKNFERWMELIGFRNEKHRKKIGREQDVTLFPESPLPDLNRGLRATKDNSPVVSR